MNIAATESMMTTMDIMTTGTTVDDLNLALP